MNCIRKCPHHVRHGAVAADGKSIEFKDMCGLSMKKFEHQKSKMKPTECSHYPFQKGFEYTLCPIYLEIFKTGNQRNNVVPTKDIQFSSSLGNSSLTDMELF